MLKASNARVRASLFSHADDAKEKDRTLGAGHRQKPWRFGCSCA
jgi:hypothetical protein